MSTLFQMGFQRATWRPFLGQEKGAGDVITQGIQSGAEAFKALTQEEIAKTQADAAKAQAAAAAAQAQAAAAAAAAKPSTPMTVLGIPISYLVVGAVVLGAAAIFVAKQAKKK